MTVNRAPVSPIAGRVHVRYRPIAAVAELDAFSKCPHATKTVGICLDTGLMASLRSFGGCLTVGFAFLLLPVLIDGTLVGIGARRARSLCEHPGPLAIYDTTVWNAYSREVRASLPPPPVGIHAAHTNTGHSIPARDNAQLCSSEDPESFIRYRNI
jgi:hypothetical protein